VSEYGSGEANRRGLDLPHGRLRFPAFLPDATQGVVRSLDSQDLLACGIEAVQTNVFHLMQRPGSATIKALGGLHSMFGWSGPIVTDSGGFQAYSLIHENPRYGTLTQRGMFFRPEGSDHRFQLTPEKSVQLQVGYGADVVICLDDCTHADAPLTQQQEAVALTVAWAKRGKAEFERRVEQRHLAPAQRPKLLAVVQGGDQRDLRRRCAEELLEIGFDGFGLGGWPLDSQGHLLYEIIAYTRELIPSRWPMHALGVGQPSNIVACAALGYDLFDSTMPTRDARHGRLCVFNGPAAGSTLEGEWFSHLYIADEKHTRARAPLSEHCDCLCCSRYSRAYLHHLFKIKDSLYFRLATLHNLRFMTQLMARLRDE
jgi:queuine tRNA-ribosyltransferase